MNDQNVVRRSAVNHFTYIAMIASMYTAISIGIAPLSFGVVQIRFAEALVLLAVFGKRSIYGVTLGCAITNAIGAAMGVNILGPIDIVVGTLATLLAALMSYQLRNIRFKGIPVLSAIPPVLVNAIAIGYELMWVSGGNNLAVFLTNFTSVAVGQVISCVFLGLIMLQMLSKVGIDKVIKSYENK